MCGIIAIQSREGNVHQEVVQRLLQTISHRGKDNQTVTVINEKTALAHARLSLIDLSAQANQPMVNEDNSLFLTFNGEIYNFKQIRSVLEAKGHVFKSNSDAEVVLHGYEEWGTEVLQRLNGMFSFVIYNAKTDEFFCARDRIGIKPLYFAYWNKHFIAASELKPIATYPGFPKKIRYTSIAEYLTYRYIPSPNTIYENVFKLPPAYYVIYKNGHLSQPIQYWNVDIQNIHYSGNIIEEIRQRLLQSVELHLISDVPVGIFLSGGIDSSTIAYLAKQLNYHPTAFTIGFKNWEKSEHFPAERIAQSLGLQHKKKILDNTIIHNIEESVYYYDEPIADISIVPTFEISRFASQYVRTVLSGEGGDELFAGYTWHKKLMTQRWFWSLNSKTMIRFYANAMSMGLFDRNELRKALHPLLHKEIPDDVFYFYRKHFIEGVHPLKAIQYLDLKTFLAELVLTKVDRASMAHTLEVRVPFLNHELVEFIFSISTKTYYSHQQTKIALRTLLKNHIPSDILNLPKQGFVGPDTFYHQLSFYKNMLHDSELVKNSIVQLSAFKHYFEKGDYWRLWKLAVLETWFRRWMK